MDINIRMNLFQVCVCVLLLTASLGGAAGDDRKQSLCTTDNLLECSEPLDHLNGTQRADLNVVCPLRQKVANCISKKMDNCPNIQNDELQRQLNEMELFLQAVCNFHEESYFIRGFTDCSAKNIVRCTLTLETTLEEGQTNMYIVCPRLVKSLACLTRSTKTCPDRIKTSFDKLYQCFAPKQKYCVSLLDRKRGQRNKEVPERVGGTGFKSRAPVLLVAAMLVVVRHFL